MAALSHVTISAAGRRASSAVYSATVQVRRGECARLQRFPSAAAYSRQRGYSLQTPPPLNRDTRACVSRAPSRHASRSSNALRAWFFSAMLLFRRRKRALPAPFSSAMFRVRRRERASLARFPSAEAYSRQWRYALQTSPPDACYDRGSSFRLDLCLNHETP